MSTSKISRITKLENNILQSKRKPSDVNIKKYGRFVTHENALISNFYMGCLSISFLFINI